MNFFTILKNYVGTTKELESYAIGLIARVRALAAGLPGEGLAS
jgi:hypothetical protein